MRWARAGDPDRGRHDGHVPDLPNGGGTAAAGSRICCDPSHGIRWANEALERGLDAIRAGMSPELKSALAPAPPPTRGCPGRTRRQSGRPLDRGLPPSHATVSSARTSRKAWRTVRFLVRSGAERLNPRQQELLDQLDAEDVQLARAWELKEGPRRLYQRFNRASPWRGPGRGRPARIRRYLRAWCQAAEASGIPAFTALARRIIRAFDGIVAAVELDLSNSRLEGINAKIRVIQRRGYGHASHDTLAAMIYLCLGGIHVPLPARRS